MQICNYLDAQKLNNVRVIFCLGINSQQLEIQKNKPTH